MKPIICIGVALLCLVNSINAQNVGIGNTNPDASARLDITATNKGLLIPRMDSTTRKNITTPAEGLLVMDTSIHAACQFTLGIWKILTPDSKVVLTPISGTAVWDYRLGNKATLNLTANITLTITNIYEGATGVLKITQDATGSRGLTMPSSSYYSNNMLGLSTAPNSRDVLAFIYMDGHFFWFTKNNY